MPLEQFYQTTKYHKINDFRKEAIIRLIGEKPNQTILDIGCGNGILGEAVKRRLQCRFYGVDISAEAVSLASKVLDGAWQVNLEDDLSAWTAAVKENHYDTIIISEVLEHLFEPEKLLLKLKELPREGKAIVITAPNVLFWKNRLKIFTGHFEYTQIGLMDREHIHFFSWQSFKEMFSEQGFEILEINNFIPTRVAKFLGLGKIWPGLFSFQFIVKAALVKTNI